MKVLIITVRGIEEPWIGDLIRALGDRHELVSFDRSRPPAGQFAGVTVVVDQGGHASREVIEAGAAEGVRLWQVLGTGLDGLDVDHVLGTGMLLANTPGPFSAPALAEHALLFILCFAKNLRESEKNVRAGRMYAPFNDELAGRTLGLIGLGASGMELARRAVALGMRVIGIDAVKMEEDVVGPLGLDWCGGLDRRDALLQESDYVSLHVPLTPATRGMIDERALSLMKPSAVLINVARGALVDEPALIDALTSGRLRGGATDVFGDEPVKPDNPLLHLDNVIATPHVAGATYETSRRRAGACAENADRMAQGLEPLYQVTMAG